MPRLSKGQPVLGIQLLTTNKRPVLIEGTYIGRTGPLHLVTYRDSGIVFHCQQVRRKK